jgi:uncharacterized RDD family membrane protein YckC
VASTFIHVRSKKARALNTPEGVDLTVEIASFGARIGAFLIDMLCIYGSIILIVLLFFWMSGGHLGDTGQSIATAGFIIIVFVLRNFWFILFEMSARGATPGKRAVGIRVIARNGGRLEASHVVARNLLRDVEIVLPLSFLFSVGSLYAALGLGWTLIFMLFPLFNKDRMRAGDLIGGTWVIRAPRTKLLNDLSEDAPHRQHYFAFTPEQIAVYGVYELQTLETLLRRNDRKAIAMVASLIRDKIGWPDGDDDRAFLNAYYSAVRANLEKGMLFGKRRESKYDLPV